MHHGASSRPVRLRSSVARLPVVIAAATVALTILALSHDARADEPQPSESPATPATVVPSEPATQDAPGRKTHPRYWLTAAGAITFGGAYVANAVLFPVAVIEPPDGPSSPSSLWYVTPVVGPFALAAKLSQFDNGLRRFEWIDGTLQTVGVAMVAAIFIFPEENENT